MHQFQRKRQEKIIEKARMKELLEKDRNERLKGTKETPLS